MSRLKTMPESYVTRSEFAEFRDDVQASLKSISDKLDAKTQPNWSALGVASTLLIVLCGSMFYYFNLRHELQDASRKEMWSQINTRIERVENLNDADAQDLKRRYRDSLEKHP